MADESNRLTVKKTWRKLGKLGQVLDESLFLFVAVIKH